jgi:glycosyltransferase involved in cell wall biosynthesis
MPLISVIVPVYNGEKTIRETLNSLFKQTFTDFEVLVINDGSQDATLEIVSSIKDPRLKVFSYLNAGPSASRNRGVALASGEYISFLDADDLWTPDKLEAQLKALQAHPEAALAYSWTDFINESNQFLRRGSYINVTGDVYKQLLLTNFLENGSNALIRQHALAEVGEFDESMTHGEDWDMWLRLAAHYPFVAVPSPQILYRVYATSSSANVSKLEAGSLSVMERVFSQFPTLEYLKPICLANLYTYLTFKTLQGFPVRPKCLIAARFFWNAIKHNPSLLQKQVIWPALLKIAIAVFLPHRIVLKLFAQDHINLLTNVDDLLLCVRLEPF